MKQLFNMCNKYCFSKKVKRLVQLGNQKVSISQLKYSQNKQISNHNKSSFSQQYINKNQLALISQNWKNLPFHQLCNLPLLAHKTIEYSLKKQSYSISQSQLSSIFNQSQLHQLFTLNPFLNNAYKLLINQNSFQNERLKSQRYLNLIQFNQDIIKDQSLKNIIQKFLKNFTNPIKIQQFAQPTFVKFLVGVMRDLKFSGIQLNSLNQKCEVKIIKALNYQYQFWYDLYHNRNKNKDPQKFIVYEKQVQNPNQNMIIRQQYPKIKIKYIARKRKGKDYQACFCIKCDILIQLDGKQHVIKVEWKGPSQGFGRYKQICKNRDQKQFMIIDFDNLYNGNPTIQKIFNI